MMAIAAVAHAVLFAFLIHAATKPVRVSSAGLPAGSIAAYVAGSTAASAAKPAEPKKPALTAKMAKAAPKEEEPSGAAGVAGAGQPGGGPVRLGARGRPTPVKKRRPLYPPFLRNARTERHGGPRSVKRPD